MKAHIIVPTVQFGNITYEVEGTSEEINQTADYVLSLRKQQEGLPDKEWSVYIDKLLNGGSGSSDTWARMSEKQKWFCHEIKKSFNRISK